MITFSFYNTLKTLLGPKTENKKAIRIELNENNSLFMDIEVVQNSGGKSLTVLPFSCS